MGNGAIIARWSSCRFVLPGAQPSVGSPLDSDPLRRFQAPLQEGKKARKGGPSVMVAGARLETTTDIFFRLVTA